MADDKQREISQPEAHNVNEKYEVAYLSKAQEVSAPNLRKLVKECDVRVEKIRAAIKLTFRA